MPSTTSRKRRALGDENDEIKSNLIAPTPRTKSPRTNSKAKTLKKTPAPVAVAGAAAVARGGGGAAAAVMIPESVDRDMSGSAAVIGSAAAMIDPTNKNPQRKLKNPNSRRALRLDNNNNNSPTGEVAPPVTPLKREPKTTVDGTTTTTVTPPEGEKAAKRRLIFGKLVREIEVKPNTKRVYSLVKKLTGSLGGNGSCGPIYGELTQGSMQKMVNMMMQYTGLNDKSRFIDVGSGIGKPNLHVTQDPGVAFSCGIEMELDRYRLGLKCLQSVLKQAVKDARNRSLKQGNRIQPNCMFLHGNIRSAHTFDPFTHVYMFSIGFPPDLWVYLSEAWNRSQSPFLICYHSPKDIIKCYEFDVELLTQIPTSMHASGEGHTGYIYQRKGMTKEEVDAYIAKSPCDKVFEEAYDQVNSGLATLLPVVNQAITENWSSGGRTMTRSEARKRGVVLSKE